MDVTTRNFDSIVASSPKVLVEFRSQHVVHCMLQRSVVRKIEDQYRGKFKVITVDVDDSPSIAVRYNVKDVPAFVVLAGGRVVNRADGLQTQSDLRILLGRG